MILHLYYLHYLYYLYCWTGGWIGGWSPPTPAPARGSFVFMIVWLLFTRSCYIEWNGEPCAWYFLLTIARCVPIFVLSVNMLNMLINSVMFLNASHDVWSSHIARVRINRVKLPILLVVS